MVEISVYKALLALLVPLAVWGVAWWVKWVADSIKKLIYRQDKSDERHNLHEVKHATMVAHQEHLIEKADRIEGKVDRLIGYANGNSGRGTGSKG